MIILLFYYSIGLKRPPMGSQFGARHRSTSMKRSAYDGADPRPKRMRLPASVEQEAVGDGPPYHLFRQWAQIPGEMGDGVLVRFGADQKLADDGFFLKSPLGPFKLYVYQHEPNFPGDEWLAFRYLDTYELCFETRYVEQHEIFLYSDKSDAHGRPGIHFIISRLG